MKITKKKLGVRVSHVDVKRHTSLLEECMNFTVVCCQLVDSSAVQGTAGAKQQLLQMAKGSKTFLLPLRVYSLKNGDPRSFRKKRRSPG